MMLLDGVASVSRAPRQVRLSAALVVVWLAFGSAFVALRVGVASVPPFVFSGTRFVLVGTLLLAWSGWRTRGRLDLRRRDLAIAAATGSGMILAGQGAASWSSQYLSPGIVAVLSSTMPIWAALVAWLAFGIRLAALGTVGLVAGFGGVVFLAWPGGGASIGFLAALVTLGGAAGWAAGAVFGSRASLARRPVLMTGLQMLAGGILQAALGLASGETAHLSLHQVVLAAPAFAYLVVVPALLGFPLFTWLLTNVPVHVANTVAYVAPVVALGLGWLLLSEPVTPRTLAAMAVILAGVGLIVWSARQKAPAPARTVGALGDRAA